MNSTASAEDPGDIRKLILELSSRGMSIKRIAEITRRPLSEVSRVIKERQKSLLRRGGERR